MALDDLQVTFNCKNKSLYFFKKWQTHNWTIRSSLLQAGSAYFSDSSFLKQTRENNLNQMARLQTTHMTRLCHSK